MNNQFIFDVVYTHLIRQQKRSEEYGMCYYKLNGLMCAIGCLIPDNLYDRRMEGRVITTLLNERKELKQYLNLKSCYARTILFGLQKIHDTVEPRQWKKALRALAHNHNLEVPQL